MPLYGKPMLSMIVPIFLSGMSPRMTDRPDRTGRAVSSMRVPVWARRCSLNWPHRTAGKKSWPTMGSRPRSKARTAKKPREIFRDGADSHEDPRYPAGSARNCLRIAFAGSQGLRLRGDDAPIFPPHAACSRYFAMVGTRVRERKYDASIAKTTASPSGTKRKFATPPRKNMGTNTMQMESVDTKAGMAISARRPESPAPLPCPFPGCD